MSNATNARVGLALVGLCASVWAQACAAEAGMNTAGTAGDAAGTGGTAGAAGIGGASGVGGTGAIAEPCVANETKSCTCVDGMPGRSVCSTAAIWSLCDCAGSAGAGGSTPFDPSLNPPGNSRSDIMFEWEETTTDNCLPGRYEGMFMCEYVQMGAMPGMGILVTGPIVMTLTESENGEFLEITDGRLDGNTFGIINFTSALSGRLNCATREFGAQAEMGLWGPILPVNPFDGVLSARYDGLTSTLSGEWALNEMLTMGICSGPWTARRVGP